MFRDVPFAPSVVSESALKLGRAGRLISSLLVWRHIGLAYGRHSHPGGAAGRASAQSSFGEGGMAANIKQIIYFHHRLDAAAAAIRNKRSDIDMFRRDFGGPAADNWADVSRAHGYHACARTEMREPWFPDARLFAKAPNLLAVC